MISLLKADLYRILKSKLTYVALAVVSVLPVIMALLYYLLNHSMEVLLDPEQTEEVMLAAGMITGRTLLTSVYSITQNAGLVIIVFGIIFISMDVSNGTLRNKVIVGHSRGSVYLSHFLATTIFNVVMMTINALVTLLCACTILKYGAKFSGEELKFLIQWIVAGTVMFIWIASLSNFFMLVLKNAALSIIFSIVIGMIIALATSLLSGFLDKSWGNALYLIPMMVSTLISQPDIKISLFQFLLNMLGYAVFIGLNTVLGIILFKKHDIK